MFPTIPNPIPYITACCCLPRKPERSNSPIGRAEYHNSRLRANLGLARAQISSTTVIPLELPARNPPSSSRPLSRSRSARSQNDAVNARGRFPVRPSQEMRFLKTDITLEHHKEVSNLVHALLGHIPYALCAVSAMIDHGYTGQKTETLFIVCPLDSRQNVLSWAATRGYWTIKNKTNAQATDNLVDLIAVPTKEGSRRVRVTYMATGFDGLQRVKSSVSDALVISLTSQLDNLGDGYLEFRRNGPEEHLRLIEAEIFWILKKMRTTKQPNDKIDRRFLRTFLSAPVFEDFTKRHPGSKAQMTLAGINVAAAQAQIQANASLREHDQLLKGHGIEVVDKQPRPFETMGMQSKSASAPSSCRAEGEPSSSSMPRHPEPTHQSRGRDLTGRKPPPRKPRSNNRPPVEWV